MKKQLVMLLACCAFVVLGAVGCAQEKAAASSGEAINTAKAMATVEEKVDYLVDQVAGDVKNKLGSFGQ